MPRRVLLAFFALLVCACAATLRAFGAICKSDLDQLIGQPAATAVAKWGAPSRTVTLPDSSIVYTWAGSKTSADSPTRDKACVMTVFLTPSGIITRWTASDGCNVY